MEIKNNNHILKLLPQYIFFKKIMIFAQFRLTENLIKFEISCEQIGKNMSNGILQFYIIYDFIKKKIYDNLKIDNLR